MSLSGTGADLDRLQRLLPPTTAHRTALVHTYYHGGNQLEGVLRDVVQDVERLRIPFPSWNSVQSPIRSTIDGELLIPGEHESAGLLIAALRCMLIDKVDWNKTMQQITKSVMQRLASDERLSSRILAMGPNASSLLSSMRGTRLHDRLNITHV